jgi:heme/copper-type cytochrome/quinol oxidase subunit 4
MEIPKRMISTILESTDEVIIITPKRKSWALIIVFTLLTLQFTIGLIQSLFFDSDFSIIERIVLFIILSTILYIIVSGLLWQLKGKREIRITKSELIIRKHSPLYKRTKRYKVEEVKNVEVIDESVSQGPIAMLQLLKITDKVKINFFYGFETLMATSGIDKTEAIKLKEIIKNQIGINE